MNEDALNTSLRKFLKTVGVTSQREIEKAIRQAIAEGRIKGNEALPAKSTTGARRPRAPARDAAGRRRSPAS